MRRRPRLLPAVAALAVLAPTVAACLGRTIDLGATPGAAGSLATSADASADGAGASPFGACRASGRIDRVYTARELVSRLSGAWAQCPGVTDSPLPCAPSTPFWGIRFAADGSYALLGATSESGPWTEEPDDCGRGTFRIYAGAGTYVGLDDTTAYNGLEVHLFGADGALDVELVEFEVEPRRLFLREQGAPTSGYFAPLAVPPR